MAMQEFLIRQPGTERSLLPNPDLDARRALHTRPSRLPGGPRPQ